MENNVTNAFDIWFENEVKNGLVDIKLAVNSVPGVSAQAIQEEILNLEVLAAHGRTTELPVATTFLPAEIQRIVSSVSI